MVSSTLNNKQIVNCNYVFSVWNDRVKIAQSYHFIGWFYIHFPVENLQQIYDNNYIEWFI